MDQQYRIWAVAPFCRIVVAILADVVDVKTAFYEWMAFLEISKTALIYMNKIVTFTVSHLKLLKSVYHFEVWKKIGFH